ncbi:MAG TPA: carboxypeptidase regulatory-like domain-containing protein [Terriglobales bacterium]|nr:carboxypeptidase regulatory-like domain-containing protein [Terriglobales bacterium]
MYRLSEGWRWASAAAVLLLGLAGAARRLPAQATATGTVVGAVTDPSGAAIPAAAVTLTDDATGVMRTVETNSAGRYLFPAVNLGTYDLRVDKAGFQSARITGQTVNVAAALTENVRLTVGTVNQTVEVGASPVAELQTMNASLGTALSGDAALALPNLGRDASSLLIYQGNTNPAGEISGALKDQNTYLLDGGNNTSDIDGNGALYTAGFSSNNSGSGVVPTPVESIQEIRVTTNNPTADYSIASGGEVMMVTKRGTSAWHGSLYDFYQANWLNANNWSDNRLGIHQQKNHQNRFGAALGGPLLPPMLGGKTFFYMNFEGRRFPLSQTETTIVPSALMRQGILQFRDGTKAIQQYNLATSTACGPTGGLPCDPRQIGISPLVSGLWSKYMPVGNNTSVGDGLNTIGDSQQVSIPTSDNSFVARIDHDFGSNWQWMASYRMDKSIDPETSSYPQFDWGGVLPGDTLGVPTLTSVHPVQPRYFVTALTGQITPNLINQFHFNYVRNWWSWQTGGVPQLLPGVPAGISVGGGITGGLDPMNINWPAARQRTWNGHDWNYSDNVSWNHGNHLVQFGGNWDHTWVRFVRDDAGGALTTPEYTLGGAHSLLTSANYRPPSCTATVLTNCIAATSTQWDQLYYETIGTLDSASVVGSRTGANLTLQPQGTPIGATSAINDWSIYASDSWHITPRLTLTYGVNWGAQMPPVEQNGAQDILVDSNGNPITTTGYLSAKAKAALAGQNYNPVLGYEPVGAVKSLGKYPFHPFYADASPRLAAAWNPHFSGGWRQRLFGSDATVLRAGWGRIYDRSNGTTLVISPLNGVGFAQAATCYGVNSPSVTNAPAACNGVATQTAATAFRLGVDGNTAPLPALPATLSTPILPGVNSAAVGNGGSISPDFRPAQVDEFTVSLQRQLPGNTILQLAWVGRWGTHEYRTEDLNQVPYMMTLGGQSFAQAYAGLANQLNANPSISPSAITPQPFFEAALAAGPGNFCANHANCTAAVAAAEGPAGTNNIGLQNVANLWNDLESHWVFGPAMIQSQGLGGAELASSNGRSTYNAGILSLQKRASNGLTLDGNLTWSHALDMGAYYQAASGSQTVDAFSSTADYGGSLYDLRWVSNITALYQIPYQGAGWQGRLFGGWSVAPIFTWHSGDPLSVINGSWEEYGSPYYNTNNDVSAIPLKAIPQVTPHFNFTSNGVVGVNQDPAGGGVGINAFANPAAVLASFRPAILGQDHSRSTIFGYGPAFWNMDLNLRKSFQVTERLGATFNLEMTNAFNHVNWADPSLDLQDPANFGTITGTQNGPRQMELGLRLHW